MADFEQAFQRLMNEEGLKLTNSQNDKGGQTYAGISRKFHPKWEGWKWVDAGETPPTQSVRDFYQVSYWAPIDGNEIKDQRVAEALLSQYVNMGDNAIKLVQLVVGVISDGKFGPKTLQAVNNTEPAVLLDKLCIAMLARYYAIGMKDRTQRVWWPGWFGRALRIAA